MTDQSIVPLSNRFQLALDESTEHHDEDLTRTIFLPFCDLQFRFVETTLNLFKVQQNLFQPKKQKNSVYLKMSA